MSNNECTVVQIANSFNNYQPMLQSDPTKQKSLRTQSAARKKP